VRKNRNTGPRLLGVILLAGLGVSVWYLWPGSTASEGLPGAADDGAVAGRTSAEAQGQETSQPSGANRGKTSTDDLASAAQEAGRPGLSAAEAAAAYRRGAALAKANRLIEARTLLSRAYYSGRLPKTMLDDARRRLTELAEITLIGPRSSVYPNDPYAFSYQFQPGELLAKVERKLKLHVPWQIILRINGLRRAEDIQAGRRYKLIRGPFHAVVYKSKFTMDIFLHRRGRQKIFVKRMRIGTGADGATPIGMWRVRLGGKQERPTWYPPPNSRSRGPIAYGQENYAFGVKGLWIGLEGLDEATRGLSGYGIHSTNDPSSIGQARSLGCIRLGDEDIELVYFLLYEHWSTVEVRP